MGENVVGEQTLDLIRQHMKEVRIPERNDKVYKDECMFSFDSPLSDKGLYLNLNTFQGFGHEYVMLDYKRTGNLLYLWEKHSRVPLSEEEVKDQQGKVGDFPTKMAIGVEGGFQVDQKKYKIEKEQALIVMPDFVKVKLPCDQLPFIVLQAINEVNKHDSAATQNDVANWEEERKVSKYANDLPQLECWRKVSPNPNDWVCDFTGVRDNLWLNLSTGHIGSGRQLWDGSGGNGAALQHFEENGRLYPLVVKLGTITPYGADVFSYAKDEDDMVLDPKLAHHLSHWGINMMQMEKTEKTIAELEIEKNLQFDFMKITEEGENLQPLWGPGYTGLKNLGNSCYMNSVLQVIWSMPEMKQKYLADVLAIYNTAPKEAMSDFASQMCKVGCALVQGKTGFNLPPCVPYDRNGNGNGIDDTPDTDFSSVSPLMFKLLVGRNHREFSSPHQQDCVEYFMHLLDTMETQEQRNGDKLGGGMSEALFRFQKEERTQCQQTQAVGYNYSSDRLFGLDVPKELATYPKQHIKKYTQQDESELLVEEDTQVSVPSVPFEACLAQLFGDIHIQDVYSAKLGAKGPAVQRMRIGTFPPYLVMYVKRYYQDSNDWSFKKLQVLVDMPDILDLEAYRAQGVQSGEVVQPEEAEEEEEAAAQQQAASTAQIDESVVQQLMSIGFPENGCRRAVITTGNSGVEPAMNWILEHQQDPNFDTPYTYQSAATKPMDVDVDQSKMDMLTGMGFTERQARAALKASNEDVEQAGDWLFTRMDNLDAEVNQILEGSSSQPQESTAQSQIAQISPGTQQNNNEDKSKFLDGPGKYELLGFVSHIGANTACGHYVAHVKKNGQWVIFNDDKVAVSQKVPKDVGYMYVYKRMS